MPLHEWLESKRRSQIKDLEKSGACHICESTNRTAHDPSSPFHPSHKKPGQSTMRTCGCYGTDPGDEGHWPYSLRVCELCVRDDAQTGRIRSCGICHAVACDDLCGVELVECTDSAEWNNAGCLECRQMESFDQIPLFRTPSPATTDKPRATRVCTKCLETATPWVKFDFTCRLFRCKTRLVPSEVVERKRFTTFVSSPLNSLPEDALDSILDFMAGEDLGKLYVTCSVLCGVAERVAKDKVESVQGEFPSGPINSETKERIHAEGKFPEKHLCVPDDGKSWVGLFYYLEKMTESSFYFGFQVKAGDNNVASRFLQKEDKFTFEDVFAQMNGSVVPSLIASPQVTVRGGQLLVNENVPGRAGVPVIAPSSRVMNLGVHRVICRLFCPGSGASRHHERLGTFGIIRRNEIRGSVGVGANTPWAHQVVVWENWRNDEYVLGMKYDAAARVLVVHNIDRFRFGNNANAGTQNTIEERDGESLQFAIELSSKAVSTKGTQLSVRDCSEAEWEQFITHSNEVQTEAAPLRAREMERFGFARLDDLFEDDGENGRPPRILREVIEEHENNPMHLGRFPPQRMRIMMERRNRRDAQGNRNEGEGGANNNAEPNNDDGNNNNADNNNADNNNAENNNADVEMVDVENARLENRIIRDRLLQRHRDPRNLRARDRIRERVHLRERNRIEIHINRELNREANEANNEGNREANEANNEGNREANNEPREANDERNGEAENAVEDFIMIDIGANPF